MVSCILQVFNVVSRAANRTEAPKELKCLSSCSILVDVVRQTHNTHTLYKHLAV